MAVEYSLSGWGGLLCTTGIHTNIPTESNQWKPENDEDIQFCWKNSCVGQVLRLAQRCIFIKEFTDEP
jgi:hypothetical protein